MDGSEETMSCGADRSSVTVVISVYNGAHFVGKAIESVLAQTMPAAEVLVINDGSTDNIEEVVGRYGEAVTLVSQPNGGISNARNTGIRSARSRYVAFLDADDWWHPRKLEAQIAAITLDGSANASYTGLTIVDVATGQEEATVPISVEKLKRVLQWCNPGGPTGSSTLISKELLDRTGPFNERLVGCEDWEMWFRLFRSGVRFAVAPEPLSYIRRSSSGVSGNADLMYETFLKILDSLLLKHRRGWNRWIWRRRILSFQAYAALLTARAEGKSQRERFYMRKSLRAWPSPFWAPERFKVFAVTLLRSRQQSSS
jgi:glycosyltransferase involved in cell wall biosynthesis